MDFFLILLMGLIIGSFLNVCIDRIPQGKSVIYPPSHCESCGKSLKPIELIPLISYLLLRGRCRHCGTSLSWRYPGLELLTGFIFFLVYYFTPLGVRLLPYLTLSSILIVISFIDLDHFRIPSSLILTGLFAGIISNTIWPFIDFFDAFLGFITGGGILLFIALVSKGGMGGGDVKLGAMIGFFLGWKQALLTIFIGAIFAATVGVIFIIGKKRSRKEAIPFGPFLSLGALISLIWGEKLVFWYIISFF
jgi:leader peptidase (prepilin peptidase)/N-methyltransferase